MDKKIDNFFLKVFLHTKTTHLDRRILTGRFQKRSFWDKMGLLRAFLQGSRFPLNVKNWQNSKNINNDLFSGHFNSCIQEGSFFWNFGKKSCGGLPFLGVSCFCGSQVCDSPLTPPLRITPPRTPHLWRPHLDFPPIQKSNNSGVITTKLRQYQGQIKISKMWQSNQ